jgi:hypothetical protein
MENNVKIPSDLLNAKYLELDSIDSNGSQYIDTGVVASTIGGLKFACTRTGWGAYTRIIGLKSSNNLNIQGSSYTSYDVEINGSSGSVTVNSDTENIFEFVQGDPVCEFYLNGNYIRSYSTLSTSSDNLWINRGGGSYYGYFKYRFFKIYDNSNDLLRDYIPAIRVSDGATGMLDRQNNVFYKSAGAGAFIPGAIVGTIY